MNNEFHGSRNVDNGVQRDRGSLPCDMAGEEESEMNKTKAFSYGLSLVLAVLILNAIIGTYNFVEWGCGDGRNGQYLMDSPCFNFTYRCEVECSNYGLDFTGIRDGCACDCGTGWVSSCSGFYYDRENRSEDKVRITGNEIVEYPNGSTEPYGVPAGIYKRGKL